MTVEPIYPKCFIRFLLLSVGLVICYKELLEDSKHIQLPGKYGDQQYRKIVGQMLFYIFIVSRFLAFEHFLQIFLCYGLYTMPAKRRFVMEKNCLPYSVK